MLSLVLAAVIAAAPTPALDPAVVDELTQFTKVMRPDISTQLARRLSRIALDVGTRQEVDPRLLLAIARIESNLEPGTVACWQKRGAAPGVTVCDHGLMQINDIWVATWDLDVNRLERDDYFNIWTAARLLVKLRAEFGSEPNWYGRYHSNIPWRRAIWEGRLHEFYSPPRESLRKSMVFSDTF